MEITTEQRITEQRVTESNKNPTPMIDSYTPHMKQAASHVTVQPQGSDPTDASAAQRASHNLTQ